MCVREREGEREGERESVCVCVRACVRVRVCARACVCLWLSERLTYGVLLQVVDDSLQDSNVTCLSGRPVFVGNATCSYSANMSGCFQFTLHVVCTVPGNDTT